jgi:hypothetical protein
MRKLGKSPHEFGSFLAKAIQKRQELDKKKNQGQPNERSRKSLEWRLNARMQVMIQEAKQQGASDDEAATSAVLQYTRVKREEAQEDDPSTYYGGNARRRIAMMRSRRGG